MRHPRLSSPARASAQRGFTNHRRLKFHFIGLSFTFELSFCASASPSFVKTLLFLHSFTPFSRTGRLAPSSTTLSGASAALLSPSRIQSSVTLVNEQEYFIGVLCMLCAPVFSWIPWGRVDISEVWIEHGCRLTISLINQHQIHLYHQYTKRCHCLLKTIYR